MTDDRAAPTLVVGLGCQRGCPARCARCSIRRCRRIDRTQAVKALASIDLKRDEPGLQELASQLALPLLYFSSEELAGYQQRLSHHSQIALSAPAATAWRKVPPWPWPSS
jgi:cobalt-precorrin 5A hydrolase